MTTSKTVTEPAGRGELAPFADALRQAIDASGLGLERISGRLRQRGATLSIATLSYWQSGRSMPGRRTSFAALAQLEDLLAVPRGALAQLVPAHGIDAIMPIAEAIGQGVELPTIVAQLDARLRSQLDVTSEHGAMVVGPDRTQRTRWTRRVMRALVPGVDRMLLAYWADDELSPLPTMIPHRHCSLGVRYEAEDSPFVVTELIFDRSLNEGEALMVEYELRFGVPYPRDTFHALSRQVSMREFVFEVQFHPDALPTRCEWFQKPSRHDSDAPEVVAPLTLGATNTLLAVKHDLPPVRYGVRWFWD